MKAPSILLQSNPARIGAPEIPTPLHLSPTPMSTNRYPNWVSQFLSYVGVGGLSFLVDISCLYLLTERLGVYYLVSAAFAFCAGLVVNYLLCLLWVFDFRRMENRVHEFLVFGAIGIAGLLLNTLLLWLLTDVVGHDYLVSKVIAAAIILVFNFSLRRWMLFSPAPTPSPELGNTQ